VTGWFSGLFGRKRFFTTCIILFTASSAVCGAAPSLNVLVLFRILQGAGGAALIPLSQAILMETFPREEQGMAMAIWGVGIMVAPIMGPTVGGWITDTYSWRWIFYINVPVGLVTVLMTSLFIFDPPYIRRRFARVDYLGFSLLALGVGSLQLVLDKGEREDWFSSRLIVYFSVISLVALITFFLVERRTREPVVDLSLLRNRTYTAGTLIMMIWGFGLYGAIVLLPLYLQSLMGYTAMQSGLALAPGAIASLMVMPLVGRLMNVLDPRVIIGV
ncbi:MAG: DHA2 family efflux MFS transporter permease subunit, partial [Anaerolineae bacterium]|nr:DHA2 family efflux MFS transporter permease subunit [Anaerolineae bacterium]NIN96105.1 DHA2 family efflux MFS transporter permease subunit [Anaerolineae bacterium]NIQ77988.1 DHA2 family efflux MFS transporter permease subunit [Anaerolineae bacterium]